MAGRVIGNADEFWRLRLTRVDTSEDLVFEWHEDILYRRPRMTASDDVELWIVEAISAESYDTVVALAQFPERDEAEAFLERARLDLEQMTKSQFETAYLTPSEGEDDVPAEDDEVF